MCSLAALPAIDLGLFPVGVCLLVSGYVVRALPNCGPILDIGRGGLALDISRGGTFAMRRLCFSTTATLLPYGAAVWLRTEHCPCDASADPVSVCPCGRGNDGSLSDGDRAISTVVAAPSKFVLAVAGAALLRCFAADRALARLPRRRHLLAAASGGDRALARLPLLRHLLSAAFATIVRCLGAAEH